MRIGVIFKFICTLVASIWVLSSSAYAQFGGGDPGDPGGTTEQYFDLDVLERANVEERLQALGNDLLGDQIDPNTGSLSFSHVDVSILGNSDLEVAIRRTRNFGDPYTQFNNNYTGSNGKASLSFGDWELGVPKISIVTATPYSVCSSTEPEMATTFVTVLVNGRPTDPNASNNVATPGTSHSNGVRVNVPGRSNGLLLDNPVSGMAENGANKTSLDHWSYKCINTGNGGLIGTAPNGDVYRFDERVLRPAKRINMQNFTSGGSNSSYSYGYQERAELVYQVSRVEDVHGNYVDYDYNAQGWLIKIAANDGRLIEITRDTAGFIDEIKANNRVWRYAYVNKSNGGRLTDVTRPDNLKWYFDLGSMTYDAIQYWGDCPAEPYSLSVRVTHPHGTIGTFSFQDTKHLRAPTYADDGLPYPSVPHCSDRGNTESADPNTFANSRYNIVASVIEKRLDKNGNGNDGSIWTYDYSEEMLPVSLGQKWSDVTDPEGTRVRRMYHINDQPELDGLVDWAKTYNSSGAVISGIDYNYTFEAPLGTTWIRNENLNRLTRPRRTTETVITQNNDTFTTETDYNTNPSAPNYSYGRPTETRSWSNYSISGVNNKRITQTTYKHDTSKWILGLPKTVTRNGRLLSKYDYTPLGQVEKAYQYSQSTPVATYSYHSDGNVRSVTDALGRRTEAHEWKRGKPQRVELAVGTPLSQTLKRELDDNGWIKSQTDAKNRKTKYQHDSMGRLTRITPHSPPTGQGYKMPDTTISYTFGPQNIQMITKGQKRDFIYYDSLLRPYLELTYDLSNMNKILTYTDYDALGRVIFKSQPSSVWGVTKGTNFAYDGLGRIKESRETVAPYATTTHEYLANNAHKVTDPEGNIVTTYHYGWNGPGSSEPYRIRQHGIKDTWIHRNVHGEIWRVHQTGPSEFNYTTPYHYFFYDAQRRLCRTRTPEGKDTLYAYNLAGELSSYAKGQNAGGDCAAPSGMSKVSLTYDDLGRPMDTIFHDGVTPDITRDYDLNGNITELNRGEGTSDAVLWEYSYDGNDQLTHENLTIAGAPYGFDIAYKYNTLGHMYRKTLPTGRNFTYTNDGLGRHTKVSWGNAVYAHDASYYASGPLETLKYGNGHRLTQTLNARLQPERITVNHPNITALDLGYSYDKNGRITGQMDYVDAHRNRTYIYDGAGRLTHAESPSWGAALYKYDPLGNLRSKSFTNWPMGGSGAGPRNITNSYDSRNRLSASNENGTVRNLSYDTRGNVTGLGNLSFLYDMSDQPIAVSSGVNGDYLYDGNLKRVKSVVNGRTIFNVYDISGRLVHVDEGDDPATPAYDPKKTDYLHGMGQTLARIENGFYTYLHPDHLGSALTGTRENATIAWTESYTPYGEAFNNAAANDNQSGFTGHIKDKSTGLNYMQARYYDPNIGRFLSIDAMTMMDMDMNPNYFNRYAYAFNDPINLLDPTGMYTSCASFSEAGNSQGCTEIPEVTGVEFETEAQAVEAIGSSLNEMSSTENGIVSGYAPEYGVAISKTENGFTPTVAVTDNDPGSVNLGGLLEGTENPIADMHSHGNDNTGTSNTFSQGDLGAATIDKQQFGTERSYVVTPSGAIHSFTPNSSMRAPVTRGQFGMNRRFVKPSNSALPDYRGTNR